MSMISRTLLGNATRRLSLRRLGSVLPLSSDPYKRTIEVAFLERVAQERRLEAGDLADHVYQLVDELDRGVADGAISANAPSKTVATAEQFDDVQEFSVDQWAARRAQ